MSNSLRAQGLHHARLPCLSWFPRVFSNSCLLNWRCHPTISSSITPFSSCPQSFPASGSFPMRWLFTSGSQSIGALASASVLPMNIQGWFPLGLTGLISLLSKGLSRVFSTTVRKHQFFSVQPSLRSNSHISLYISLNKTNKQKKPQDCCSDLSLNAMGACAGPRFESGELVKSPALNKWGWNESLGRILPSGREI